MLGGVGTCTWCKVCKVSMDPGGLMSEQSNRDKDKLMDLSNIYTRRLVGVNVRTTGPIFHFFMG